MKLPLLIALSVLTVNAYAADITTPPKTEENKPMQTVKDKPEVSAKKTGEDFLKTNQMQKDVVTLKDGLQYKVLTEGKGAQPTKEDSVTVHYVGRLINGTEFDSSYKRNEPATFPLNAVIPGWTEALQLMKEGSTWEIYIPADLAYGEQGAPPLIGPNETLIFKVNLISVSKKK